MAKQPQQQKEADQPTPSPEWLAGVLETGYFTSTPQPADDGHQPWRNRIVGYGYVPHDKLENSLLYHPDNWRIHPREQTDALEGVFMDVGVVQNVIVSVWSHHLLDGHDRVKLAAQKGAGVSITWVDVTPDEETLILATFDNITGLAVADADKLAMMLDDLRTRKIARNPRLQEMLADLRDKHQPSEKVLPRGASEADYTENPYAAKREKRLAEQGDEEPGGEGNKVRVVQLFFTPGQYSEVLPLLQGLGSHFNVDNVTDTVLETVMYAASALKIAPEEPEEEEAPGGGEGEDAGSEAQDHSTGFLKDPFETADDE